MNSDSGAADGRRLRPFRRHEVLHRTLYTIEHRGPDGGRVRYTVDVDVSRDEGAAELYADGLRQAKGDPPVSFPVPGGVIDVDISLYGIRRMHLVLDDGSERRLGPVSGSLEDLRGRLHRRRPRLSRAIGWLAIGILVVNLVLAVPQALEMVTGIPKIAALTGSFTSPVDLPTWLNFTLLLSGALAGVERVLTLRSNRVLDVETLWTGF
ncbi:hypothetical protein ACFO4E_07380 [Nocardiopsis mangrovi]|uniref:Uncharacterized protein n=1 Tax=Nocardiopsis mangrovi TaxID=1179818 RepID=A0ABV9DRZ0_9ACTN